MPIGHRRHAKSEIAALGRVLMAGSAWCHELPSLTPEPETDPAHAEQLVRDNAIRLLDTLDLAKPFACGRERPCVLECGAGSLYGIEAFRWRFGNTIDLRAVEHPDATTAEVRVECDHRSVKFATCDLVSGGLPWPGENFDLIVLTEVIEHIPPTQLPDMLRAIATRLKPDGALLLSSPNSQAIWNVLSLAIGNGQMLDVAFPPEHGFYGHIRMYARKEVEALLDYAGLELYAWQLSNWMHAHPAPGASLSDRVRLGVQRTVGEVVPRWASGWICTGVPNRGLDGGGLHVDDHMEAHPQALAPRRASQPAA